MMDIIFLWDSTLNNENEEGVFLSGKYIITYELEKNSISIKKNDDYVDGFWGENVKDCFAIVGENGAGKTMLVNRIMNIIKDIKYSNQRTGDYFLICENQSTKKLYIFYTKCFENIEIKAQDGIQYQMVKGKHTYLNQYKVAYFHNALSKDDYFVQSRCDYDFSLGQMIKKFKGITYNMHYDDINKDVIRNYYVNDEFRIISFLYDYAMYNDLEIDFPMPQTINIKIADEYFSEMHIMKEAEKLRVKTDEKETPSKEVKSFNSGVDNIVKVYGRRWINYTIKNLILNCFKELCIPETVPSNKKEQHWEFFDACSFLNDENEISKIGSVYKCAFKIISNLQSKMGSESDKNYINTIKEFVCWLEKNEEEITKYENKALLELIIPVEHSTEGFMTELKRLYLSSNFAFPFYDFSFGVSTGEYCFLSIFSNIYSLIEHENRGINVYDYPKIKGINNSVLLIFDEVDLSMHPKLQRMYMKWLTNFCEQLFQNISVKIIVTTHSPILLSDFPANSILYLKKNDRRTIFCRQEEINTFGCNIHSLFLNSFFLKENGTMGAFAEEKINGIAEILFKENIDDVDLESIEKIIRYIGEGIIKQKLEEILNEKEEKKILKPSKMEKGVIRDMLSQLKDQRRHLEQLINNLEEAVNDKN